MLLCFSGLFLTGLSACNDIFGSVSTIYWLKACCNVNLVSAKIFYCFFQTSLASKIFAAKLTERLKVLPGNSSAVVLSWKVL